MKISANTCDCKDCDLKMLFFGKIEEKELANICNIKKERFYRKGEIIISEGDKIDTFSYIKSGLVKLHRKINNKRNQIIKFAGPLDYVNLLSIFSNLHHNYTVTAINDSTICSIQLTIIKKMALENGKFAIGLLEKMSAASDDIIKTFLDIRKKHLRGRIAYVLLFFSDKVYKNFAFELPVSRKEIAELIEMTTENVIRILSEFRKDKIIVINGKTIEIINIKMLRQINDLG